VKLILPLILLASIGTAHAQISISADVDKTDVALNEQIVLGVTVTGPEASLPEPEIPSLPNFSIYSSGRNQSITFVNGKVSSSIVFTYVLEPRFVGKGVIPPISVTYQGHQAQTSPIEIQVRKPGGAGPNPTQAGGAQNTAPPVAPAQPGQASRPTPAVTAPTRSGQAAPVFVQAQVDKKAAFVNEQVTLTIGFYTAINLLGNPQYIAPKTDGFLAEDLPPERHGQRMISGRNYYYSEIKTALFPAHAGKLTVSPATVRVQIQQSVGIDPTTPDFFERFFAGGLIGAQTRDLASEPLIITAQALPEDGKPKGFSGAVGSFSISAAPDRTQVKVGDAVNLTVTVSGDGNLKAIGDPLMPELPSFRVYDTVSSLNLNKKDDRVQGSKVFKTVLVPRVSGDLAVAPIKFSYFDPAKRSYMTAETLPLTIKVVPAPGGSAVPAGSPTAGSVAPQGLSSVIEDIRYLHVGARPWSTRLLEAIAGAGPVNATPFLVFAFCVGLVQYREFGLSDPLGARHRRAWKAASNRIKQASQLAASDPHKSAGLMADALSHYLADKLGQRASGLTLRAAQELLRAKNPGLQPALLERIRELWDELDMRRFAPSQAVNGEQAQVSDSLRQLLEELEKELKK
jgi:hypothetical protein